MFLMMNLLLLTLLLHKIFKVIVNLRQYNKGAKNHGIGTLTWENMSHYVGNRSVLCNVRNT